MFPEGLLERERFDKRPVEPIIVAQKYAQFDDKFSVLLEWCLNSNFIVFHFCRGRGCLFQSCSEVCQSRQPVQIYRLILKKILPNAYHRLMAPAGPCRRFRYFKHCIQPLGGIVVTCTPEQPTKSMNLEECEWRFASAVSPSAIGPFLLIIPVY